MDPQLLSIHYSDPLWIAIAFLCGLAIRGVGLPPMVGFLVAGFMLNALCAEGCEFLNAVADLGITLLLFSIGLKLKLKSLARPEVWGVATLHMAVVTLLIAAMVLMFSYTSLPLLSGLDTQTALLIGFTMSKANELAKALFGFKELFLVGFYLTVGMTAVPGWTEVLVALLFILVLPIKVALYFSLFSLFCLRASTSWRTSLNLANYSEFGLIVCALAASAGWLPKEWLAVFAVVISISFILAAPLVNIRDSLYQTWRPRMKRFERRSAYPAKRPWTLRT